MKWLLITEDYPPDFYGGIASWAQDLSESLLERGESVEVWAKSTPGSYNYDRRQQLTILRMPGRSWSKNRHVWVWLATKRHFFSDGETPEIVIFATWELARIAAPLFHSRGSQCWVSCHGSDISRAEINEKALKRLAPYIKRWLPLSGYLEGLLHSKLPEASSTVIPVPVDIPWQVERANPKGPILVVSRLTARKGIDRAIHISVQLNQELWIIGDGPEKERLEKLAKKQKGSKVVFLGRCSREKSMDLLSRAAACFLLSTAGPKGEEAEGLGICHLEAAARGIPCVGTPTGGIPEALGPGLLLNDKKEDIPKIQAFIRDPLSRKKSREWLEQTHGKDKLLNLLIEMAEEQ